jgi:hypothetical protein
MTEEQIRRESIIAAQAVRIRKMRLSREAVEVNMEEAARKLIEALEESYSPQKIARRIGWNVLFLRSMKKGVITCSHDTFLQLFELHKEATKR